MHVVRPKEFVGPDPGHLEDVMQQVFVYGILRGGSWFWNTKRRELQILIRVIMTMQNGIMTNMMVPRKKEGVETTNQITFHKLEIEIHAPEPVTMRCN